MSKRQIRIDLGNGAWARVSPDIMPETVEALRRMVEAVRRQHSKPITLSGFWQETPAGEIEHTDFCEPVELKPEKRT